MRINSTLTVSVLLLSLACHAQLLLPQKGKEPGFHPKFNPEFVSSHRIKEIRCEMAVKPDGKKIQPTGDVEIYRFARDGRIEMIRKIGAALPDTGFTFYYFAGSRLDCEMKNDASGMLSYCYTYTDNGYVAEQIFGRTERFEQVDATRKPRDLPLISTEKYEYRRYENQVHGTLFNSANRPYQKETWYYDENGYLESYLKSFVMSSGREKEDYVYDSHGWVSRRTIEINRETKSWEYTYDKVGNLIEETLYESGEQRYTKEMVYAPNTFLIQAELSREDDRAQIRLVNYTYTYW